MEFDQGFSLIFLGISAILIISLMVWYNWNEQKEYKLGREKIKTIRPDVEHIDNKIDIILLDLGKWINKCRKCNSSVNFIKNYSEKYINLSCEGCGKISTLHQFNDHKYQIDSIPEFYYSMTKMQSKSDIYS